MHSQWTGIFTVLVTPMNRDYRVDLRGLHDLAAFAAAGQTSVIVALGSEGEFASLSDQERIDGARTVVEAVRGRKPVIVCVAHSSAYVAATLAQHAAQVGADAVLATGPYFGVPAPDLIESHFGQIAECGLPVFVYNSPHRVGYDMPFELLDALLSNDRIVGVKQASDDPANLSSLTARPGTKAIIGGSETTILNALLLGANGNTATAASIIPEVFAALWDAHQSGRLDHASDIYAILEPLRTAYKIAGGQAAVVKRLGELRGLPGGPARPPARELDEKVDDLLRRLLADLKGRGFAAA